jgi:hypothetical protein
VRGANAPLDSSVGAPLVAAMFSPCAVRDTNASLDGSVGTPFLAATSPHAVRDANAPLSGSVLVHPSFLQFVLHMHVGELTGNEKIMRW